MKLIRIGAAGEERPAVLTADGTALDLRPIVADIDGGVLARDLDRIRDAVARGILDPLPTVGRYGPPLAGVGKIVCVGLNYADHAAETNQQLPSEPVLFMKAPDTMMGPDDTVLIPRTSVRTDYEVELAVVIGATARYLHDPTQSRGVIAGYAISDDVSERDFQLHRGGQWDKGKNCDTFNPFGPWLVTADEVRSDALFLRLSVNGELRQDSSTAQMAFGVDHLVWYISQFMTLHPGDVINTGTPAGVALGRGDTGYLAAGDVVHVEIEGLGTQQHTMGAA